MNPDTFPISKTGSENDILHLHHQPKYQYCGEPGGEYRVIAGIFKELNDATHLENKHIRWYAVISYLAFIHRSRRQESASDEISILLSGMLTRNPALSGNRFNPFLSPVYIDILEPYIIWIARLGTSLSWGPEKDDSYMKHHIGKITRQLSLLLSNLDRLPAQPSGELLYRLVVEKATEHMVLHFNNFPGKLLIDLKKLKESELFKRVITRALEHSTREFFQWACRADDFWNGLIP